jgi:hypothetical protein
MSRTTPDRFERLRGTATFSGEAHERWRSARLGIVGAGVLGGQFVREAARSGAQCDVYDPGTGEEVNRGTQDVVPGEPKADSLARGCDRFAPDTVRPYVVDVRHVGAGRFEDVDLIVDCSDDPSLAYPLTMISNGWAIPMLRLAVDGSGQRELGRVLASHGGGDGACQICSASWREAFEAGPRTPCIGARPSTAPTVAGSALAMTIAGLGLLCAQRIVGGHTANAVLGHELIVDLDRPQILSMTLPRSDSCLTGHRRWAAVRVARDAQELTVGELLTTAAIELTRRSSRHVAREGVYIQVADHPLQPSLMCGDCGHPAQEAGTEFRRPPLCTRCGGRTWRRRDISIDELDLAGAEVLGIVDRSLADLGFPDHGALVRARTTELPALHLLLP